MTPREFHRIVLKFGGWIEGEVIRFPSPDQLAQFLAHMEKQYEQASTR